MISSLVKPFLRRFLGLFFSMAFVSMLAIALLVGFGSAIANLKETQSYYQNQYGNIDGFISTDYVNVDRYEALSYCEGVDMVQSRLSVDAFMKKKSGRNVLARAFSFNANDEVEKLYFAEEKAKKENSFNIAIARRFAINNEIHLGDTISLGYFGVYLPFHVYAVVETPKTMYVRPNAYVWSDNYDFGYVYLEQEEITKGLAQLAKEVKLAIESNPILHDAYEELIKSLDIDVPDLEEIAEKGASYVTSLRNQILYSAKEGADPKKTMDGVLRKLEEGSIDVKTSSLGEELPYVIYMKNAIRQMSIAAIFLPVFFFFVTMVVIILFMNQIVKSMTKDIGILMSIGIGKWPIIGLFSVFALLVSFLACLLGVGLGGLLNAYLGTIFASTYSLPIINYFPHPLWSIVACFAAILVTQGATLLSCLAIFRITPKDATINNESKRRPLPKWLARFIDKAPMNLKLSTNSIAQNPRRFFVSFFSIFAAYLMIIATSFFSVSCNTMIRQATVTRLPFDCQIYLPNDDDGALGNDLKLQSFVEAVEECGYTYLEVQSKSKSEYIECLGVKEANSQLIYIPDQSGNGRIYVPEEGLILARSHAELFHVGVGDYLTLGGKSVVVTAISEQLFHPICFMSMAQLDLLEANYVSTYFVNYTSDVEFANYLSAEHTTSMTVYSASLKKDLEGRFSSINTFVMILIGFSFLMGVIILSIMAKNSLMEQMRQLSVMRSIGFRLLDVSNVLTIQSLAQLILAAVFAIPSGYGITAWLFKLASSVHQTYPSVFSFPLVLMGFAFVLGIVAISHGLSMLTIRNWNLADNTRCRE